MKNIKKGLEILLKYEEDGDFAAEHDIIYAGDSELVEKISEADIKLMDDLGWFIDEEFGCWCHFC